MRRASPASLASLASLALLALLLAGCPKRHKSPEMDRVWLGPKDGCARIKSGGTACWGTNLALAMPQATQLFGGAVRDVALGDRYQCALKDDGTVLCRDGGAVDAPHAGAKPERVLGIAGATAIGSGGGHACALLGSGEVWCWGENSYGQLGDGTTETHEAPVKVHVGPAKAVALGQELTCVAQKEPKSVKCFGRGTTKDDLLAGEDVTQLTAGLGHACALLAGGGVRCWGADVHGQVGDGQPNIKVYPPVAAGVADVVEVRAGYNHTCARLRDETVVCWGANNRHQMADGTTDSRMHATRVQGLHSVTSIAAAGDATCAVLSLDASVRCWGANGRGQLGDGTTEEHTVPMPLRWAH